MSVNYDQIAQKYDLSPDAVKALAEALQRGNGTLAQFNHPELGGMGQWMPGMVMVGDMFNNALKAKIDGVCTTLASTHTPSTMAQMQSNRWWDAELGQPKTSGAQNETRYAYFPDSKRLLVMRDGKIKTYHTGSHRIVGVSQQQSNNTQSLVFQTDQGVISEADLDS